MGQRRDHPRKGRQPLAGSVPPGDRRADQGRGGHAATRAGTRRASSRRRWHDASLARPPISPALRGCSAATGFGSRARAGVRLHAGGRAARARARWPTSARLPLPRWRRHPTAATNSRRFSAAISTASTTAAVRRRERRGNRRSRTTAARGRGTARWPARRKAARCRPARNSSSARHFQQRPRRACRLPAQALRPPCPHRRSFRTVRTPRAVARSAPLAARNRPRRRRHPSPLLRRRQIVPRKLLLLIDVSGSMELYTSDYLKLRHAVVQGAPTALKCSPSARG